MKQQNARLIIAGAMILGAGLLFGGWCGTARAQESITSYQTGININADASARVTETIVYDFGPANPASAPRHGIIRTISLSVPESTSLITLDDFSITDRSGASIPFTTTIADNTETVRIGNPNVTVTGQRTYVISYTVHGGIRYFSDHDEWYWNAIGSQWNVSVQTASATITLPPSPSSATPMATCYTGFAGSRSQNCTARVINGTQAVFAATRPLISQEAFTIALGFSKNVVAYVKPIQTVDQSSVIRQAPLAAWGIPFGAVFIILAIVAVVWMRKKRSSRPGSPIPQYTPPQNVSPLEVAALAADPLRKGLVAQIIFLAAQGYLTIQYLEKKTLGIFSSHDFSLSRVTDKNVDSTSVGNVALMGILFPGGATTTTLSDLTNQTGRMAMRRVCTDLVQQTYGQLVDKGYLSRTPRQVMWKYILFGFLITFVLLITSGATFGASGMMGVFVASMILLIGTPWTMIGATAQGRELFWYIQGLKLYISVAEQQRIAFHDAPEKNPQHFQDLLPYAIALGVEKKWAQKFDGLFTSDDLPWYAGQQAHVSPSLFTGALSKTFATSFMSMAGVSSSGPSGFSGGAGAGGGGGGGGGGSW